MKKIRNLTVLMAGMFLASAVTFTPIGTGLKIDPNQNISVSLPENCKYNQSLADSLKEKPINDCTVEAFDDDDYVLFDGVKVPSILNNPDKNLLNNSFAPVKNIK